MTSLPTWRRWTLLRPRRPHSGDVGRCCGRDGRAAGRVPVPGTAALRKSGPEVADDELTNLATLDIAAAETAALRGRWTLLRPRRPRCGESARPGHSSVEEVRAGSC